jgi:hypothetical protein
MTATGMATLPTIMASPDRPVETRPQIDAAKPAVANVAATQ